MAACFFIDPVTLDLVRDGGGFKGATTAQAAHVMALNVRYGEWVTDPRIGSRLHDLGALGPFPAAMVADDARRALGYVESLGLIADVAAEAAEVRPGVIALQTSCRDVSTGQPVDAYAEMKTR